MLNDFDNIYHQVAKGNAGQSYHDALQHTWGQLNKGLQALDHAALNIVDSGTPLLPSPKTIWPSKDRVGSSDSQFDFVKSEGSDDFATMTKAIDDAYAKLPKLSSGPNGKYKHARKQLKSAKKQLHDIQARYNRQVTSSLAQSLQVESFTQINQLQKQYPGDKELEKATQHFSELTTALSPEKMQTKRDALRQHAKIKRAIRSWNTFYKGLDKQEKAELEGLNKHCHETAIIGNRMVDDFYKNPPRLSFADKFRQVFSGVMVSLGGMACLSGLVCGFVFPPAALPLALIGAIATYPMWDKIGELFKNAWYGRAPLKSDLKGMGKEFLWNTIALTPVHIVNAIKPVLKVRADKILNLGMIVYHAIFGIKDSAEGANHLKHTHHNLHEAAERAEAMDNASRLFSERVANEAGEIPEYRRTSSPVEGKGEDTESIVSIETDSGYAHSSGSNTPEPGSPKLSRATTPEPSQQAPVDNFYENFAKLDQNPSHKRHLKDLVTADNPVQMYMRPTPFG
ncbi:MAG: hypothetical protein DHS20C10_10750 [marine bacterium B5-7]|nr:MAG: hypothetical protein DHS20C10_10750 [marine bacterium B5-7]